MFKLQPLALADSYKLSHAPMYPEGTEYIYSNFTPRSNKNFKIPDNFRTDKVVFFGLQATLVEMVELWKEEFFKKDVNGIILQFSKLIKPFIGDNKFNFESVRQLHELGYLPFLIKALPEGSRVNVGVPVFTIVNTDTRFFWLTNYVESYLSAESWKILTNATMADRYRAIIEFYADVTGGSKEFIDFQGHDFSFRGMSGSMDAVKNTSGHALSFSGSDNIHAVSFLQYYYGAGDFVFCSVPASEHSVMTAGGEDSELETMCRLIQDEFPSGPISVVCDSWDWWNVVTPNNGLAAQLKDIILNRGYDSNGLSKVVFRPDSGDPYRIICGYNVMKLEDESFLKSYRAESELRDSDYSPYEYKMCDAVEIGDIFYKIHWVSDFEDYGHFELGNTLTSDEVKGAVQCLWDIFGGTFNDKCYKTLNQKVGLIYGDSITPQRAVNILEGLKYKGFASDNIVFGIGSFTYQYNTRDTHGMAMKATWTQCNGVGKELFKNPKTDNGIKKSAKGLLRVEMENGGFVLYDQQTPEQEQLGELRVVFENGKFYNIETLDIIKQRLRGND